MNANANATAATVVPLANSALAFCLSLFLYIHIRFHLKKSSDLDVYHIDYPSKEKLDEICDIRQPVVFGATRLENASRKLTLASLARSYPEFDLNIIGAKDDGDGSTPVKFLPVKIKDASVLLASSGAATAYRSESNGALLAAAGLSKNIQGAEYILRPSLSLRARYDVAFGNVGHHTPLRHHLNYRNYVMVTSGAAGVMMAAPKYTRELVFEADYGGGGGGAGGDVTFVSSENPWPSSDGGGGSGASNDVNYLYVELRANQIIYVPAYWSYSVRFEQPGTSLLLLYYQTYMGYASCLRHNALAYMQSRNVKYTSPTAETETETDGGGGGAQQTDNQEAGGAAGGAAISK